MSYESLMKKVLKNNIPLSLSLELTYRCNLKCNICYQCATDEEELSTSEIKNLLSQLADEGCLHLSLTGGEPLLRDDFWEIAEYAKNLGYAIILQTNGTLIRSDEADRIKDLGLLQVHISILGAEDETHDAITGVRGSFKRAANGARLLAERGVTVLLKTTVMKENFNELRGIKILAEDLGAKPYFSPTIYPKTDKSTDPLKHRISDKEMKEFFIFATEGEAKPAESELLKGAVPICNMGKSVCSVSPKGEVFPCVAVPVAVGSIKEKTFKEIWQSAPELKRMRTANVKDFKKCGECDLAVACLRCPGLSILEEGDIFDAPSECCRNTKIMQEVIDVQRKEKV